jgi:hypothetical protein
MGSSWWNENWQGQPKYSEKFAPLPLCTPQIPHDLTTDWSRAAEVGSRRLTALTMALPEKDFKKCCRPHDICLHLLPQLLNKKMFRELRMFHDCRTHCMKLSSHFAWRVFRKLIPIYIQSAHTFLSWVVNLLNSCYSHGVNSELTCYR